MYHKSHLGNKISFGVQKVQCTPTMEHVDRDGLSR